MCFYWGVSRRLNEFHQKPENNRKMNPLHRCYVKQKPRETQRFCAFLDSDSMKLGFTAFLRAYDDPLDSMYLCPLHLPFHFRSTQPTKTEPSNSNLQAA